VDLDFALGLFRQSDRRERVQRREARLRRAGSLQKDPGGPGGPGGPEGGQHPPYGWQRPPALILRARR